MANQTASARKPAEMQAESAFTLKVVRRLKAPQALVFKMFTDAAHLARWFGPVGFTCSDCTVEARLGGRFYADMLSPDGNHHRVQGVFKEILPDRRVGFTWAWLDQAGMPRTPGLETIVTIDLVAQGDETELTLRHVGFENADQAGMHTQGWESCFVSLAQYLAELAA